MMIKNAKLNGIKQKDCECCLEYTNDLDDLIKYKWSMLP